MGTILVLAVVGLTRLFFGLVLLPPRLAFAAARRRPAQSEWQYGHAGSWPPPVAPGGCGWGYSYSDPAPPSYWAPPRGWATEGKPQ